MFKSKTHSLATQTVRNLIPTDLLFLQKHIKLGKKHLESCLSQKEIDAIFHFVRMPPKTEKDLSGTIPEIAGQFSLIFNTILTGSLGFWLGLSGLLKLNSASPVLLIGVLSFSFLVGGFVGLQSILLKRRIAGEALDQWKLKDLEIQILKKINQAREKELNEKVDQLSSVLKSLKIDVNLTELTDPQLDCQKLCLKWVYHFRSSVQIREALEKKIRLRAQYDENTKDFKKLAQKLSDCSMDSQINNKPRIQANLSRLIVEAIPSLFGVTASLFVYIGGARTGTEAIQNSSVLSFLESPEVKTAQLIFVGLISFYFACSFFYMNRKAFKRDQKIKEVEILLIKEEKRKDLLDDQLLKIKECLVFFKKPIQVPK